MSSSRFRVRPERPSSAGASDTWPCCSRSADQTLGHTSEARFRGFHRLSVLPAGDGQRHVPVGPGAQAAGPPPGRCLVLPGLQVCCGTPICFDTETVMNSDLVENGSNVLCVLWCNSVTTAWASGSLTCSSTWSLRCTSPTRERTTEIAWNISNSTSLWSIRSTVRRSTSTSSVFTELHHTPLTHFGSMLLFTLLFSSRPGS